MLRKTTLAVGDSQRDIACPLGAAEYDHQLAIEEFHSGLGEGLQRRGIAIAGGLETSCPRNLECQLVGGIGNECTLLVNERHGDKGQVVAISL